MMLILWYFLGSILFKDNEISEAIKAYQKAVEINPKHFESYYSLGKALFKLGEYENSLKAFDQALELYPNSSEVWLAKAQLQNQLEPGKNTPYFY